MASSRSRIFQRLHSCQSTSVCLKHSQLVPGNAASLHNHWSTNTNWTKSVSTWSPFAAAFNTRPQRKLALKLMKEKVGLFCLPELRDHTGFYLLKQGVEEDVDRLLEEACSPHRKRKMVAVFDQLSDTLCRVADLADFVRIAHPRQDFAQAAEETCVQLSSLVEKLNTNTSLHGALKKVVEEGDSVPTDSVDRRVAELFMFDFEQSGIHLEDKKRAEFVKLNEKIHMLSTFFQRGTQKAVGIPRSSLPENLRHVFGVDGDNVMVTGLFADHYSSMVREAAYRIFLHPDSHQDQTLMSLLSCRDSLAQLVGFDTYSHRTNRGTMLERPEEISKFLDLLSEQLKPRAASDFAEMLSLKQESGEASKVMMPWDPPYLSAMGRQQTSAMPQQDRMPYFSLGSVMEGLNQLFQCLFAVSLHHVEMEQGEAWAEDIYKLAVVHAKEGVLGYIYCDFFERHGKPNQDCHFTIQGGRCREDGTYQLPIVVLQLSLAGPRASSMPALLSMGNVDNLFHEFGHAMHSMLGRTRYQHVTGTRCSTDFAEVPSVLMEYFASEPKVLSTFARHYKTGEPLTPSHVKNICDSKRMFAAADMQQQVFFSMLDQKLHGRHPLAGSSTDILAETQAQYYNIPHVPDTAWHLRFGHLVGYGARYYVYLVSRAVASQVWHTCFKDDPFNRAMGTRYREEMLAHGGEKHPTSIVGDMLGQSPSAESLAQALIQDMDASSQALSAAR